MADDITSNISITTSDGTAILATDYGTSGIGVSAAHVQLAKLAWGSDSITKRVSETYPLPTYLYGTTGSALIGITGAISSVSGSSFVVKNETNGYLVVAGPTGGFTFGYNPVQISGRVQGITNGTLVGVTGTVTLNQTLSIQGVTTGIAVGVTGGRFLKSATDSISVIGTVGLSGGIALTAASNSVACWGSDLGGKVLTRLYASDGATIGYVGDALNVNIVGAGITATVSINPVVGVTNGNGLPLKICGSGVTTDAAVIIQGKLSGGAVEIGAVSPVPVGICGNVLINDANIVNSLESTTKPLISNLVSIRTNTNGISTINEKLNTGVIQSKITEIAKPTKLINSVQDLTVSVAQLGTNTTLRVGAHLKAPLTNTQTIYVGSRDLITSPNSGFPLEPGESIFIEIDNITKLYAKASGSGQKIAYIAS
jgi:hypothetical protein